eukprot:TRINITY_DN36929_c0_g2_i1.p1 TRINITY_DN36929_c0_g2~~TRINITY_DN36929_c0_g2_i1.p1  ORF type:complete len:556 (+),score=109.50 TRINITY_DN36929_c0_g2_i1:25-1692(+)
MATSADKLLRSSSASSARSSASSFASPVQGLRWSETGVSPERTPEVVRGGEVKQAPGQRPTRPQSAPSGRRSLESTSDGLDWQGSFLQLGGGQDRGPREGETPVGYRKVETFEALQEQIASFVHHLSIVWGQSNLKQNPMSQVMYNSVKVRTARNVYLVPGCLLPELLALARWENPSLKVKPGQAVKEVHLRHDSRYLPHVFLLLKMRWLLRLHSASCELDCKLCSLANVIQGLQHIALQHHEDVYDSFFDGRDSQNVGHVHIDVTVENLLDQMQRVLGTSWSAFVKYVESCNPHCSMRMSKTSSLHRLGSRQDRSQLMLNESLAICLETAFVANFLRQRPSKGGSLCNLYQYLRRLGVQEPALPKLGGLRHLAAWMAAQDRPTRKDNLRVQHRQAGKLAQLEAVLLAAALELESPEVLEDTPMPPRGSLGRRKILLKEVFLELATFCIHHHSLFPAGLRERIAQMVAEEFPSSCPSAPDDVEDFEWRCEDSAACREVSSGKVRAVLAASLSADAGHISKPAVLEMRRRERNRLLAYQLQNHSDTLYLRATGCCN